MSKIPPRAVLIELLEEWSFIKHQKLVAELALKIANRVARSGEKVDEDTVYAGALVHDFGLTTYVNGELPWHNLSGAKLLRDLGIPEALARCVECHDGGMTLDEMKELNYPQELCRRDTIPTTWEEKIVAFADISAHAVGIQGRDIWDDPRAAGNASYPYVNGLYQKRTGHSITRDHPIIQRINGLAQELTQYCRPMDFEGLQYMLPGKGPLRAATGNCEKRDPQKVE